MELGHYILNTSRGPLIKTLPIYPIHYMNEKRPINDYGLKIHSAQNYQDFNITSFTITLGTNCNTDCRYCFQRKYVKEYPNHNINFHEKHVDEFLKNLDIFFKNFNIDKNNITSIYFWGGEPLVYWKTIKALVPELEKIFPNLRRFITSTNGILLDEDKLLFCAHYRLHLQISDDGFVNKLRGIKVNSNIDNIRRLINSFFKKYPNSGLNLQIHSTISNNNIKVSNIINNLFDIYGNNFSNLCIVPTYMPLFDKERKEVERFDRSQWKDILEETIKAYAIFERRKSANQTISRNNAIEQFILFDNIDHIREYGNCNASNGSHVIIDKNLNLYGCRDIPFPNNILGNGVKDPPQKIFNNFKACFYKIIPNKTGCLTCCFRRTCNGMCPLMDNDMDGICEVYFLWFMGMVIPKLKTLLNADLLSVETDIDVHPRIRNALDVLNESL